MWCVPGIIVCKIQVLLTYLQIAYKKTSLKTVLYTLYYKTQKPPLKKNIMVSLLRKAEWFKVFLSDIFQPYSDLSNADNMDIKKTFRDLPLTLTPVAPNL